MKSVVTAGAGRPPTICWHCLWQEEGVGGRRNPVLGRAMTEVPEWLDGHAPPIVHQWDRQDHLRGPLLRAWSAG